MIGIERRLARLEAASDIAAKTLVIYVDLMPRERDLPATATVGGRVWHREPDEAEQTFLSRVGREARLARPADKVLVAFLDKSVAQQPESRSEAAEASARRLPSFVKLELMGRD